jgi:hypothetical protein
MKQACFIGLLLCFTSMTAQLRGDFIESTSRNEHLHGTERTLQYRPEGDEFVCVNGKNRYTRALYGSHTPFRVETSDRPVFAFYNNGKGGNISFRVVFDNGLEMPLDRTDYCEARYSAGKRTYRLTDSSWGKGEICITVMALAENDGAIWRFSPHDMPEECTLHWIHGGADGKRLSRNGDLGVDPADSFELPTDATDLVKGKLPLDKESYLVRGNVSGEQDDPQKLYAQAEEVCRTLASQLRIETPDPYLNTLGGTLMAAADGIWDEKTYWQHGAVGWRMPLNGWRAAYVGDVVGSHDRARRHFDGYAASQITNVEPVFPHPTQDSALNLARAEKRWGTQMYSNGYITRNPGETNKMHHYDMNLVYIDALLRHFDWTGDTDYVKKMWPVLKRHLAWEKRNFDPDDDGLYDAYACIWASDALQYGSGGVTHSSAYNYRANKTAAKIALKIGEDATVYEKEAAKIMEAINRNLWLPRKGWWAEYKDLTGNRLIHHNAAVWTIYLAIDSDIHDPFQAYQATRYVDTEIPHIPVSAKGLEDEGYQTISTTNWLPYSWSINNVAFAEVAHTSLAYWQAGRKEEAFQLFKSAVLDGMYLGASPGNIGQISFYDAARGECYRDFGDPIGVYSRALVQGLFGILPDALNDRLAIRPGFPADWNYASIETPDLSFDFSRKENAEYYLIDCRFPKQLSLDLLVNARKDRIASVKVNNIQTQWIQEEGISNPVIRIECPKADQYKVEIIWTGDSPASVAVGTISTPGEWELTSKAEILKIYDPQLILNSVIRDKHKISAKIAGEAGNRTFFIQVKQGGMIWWQPVNILLEKPLPVSCNYGENDVVNSLTTYETVNMDSFFNESVSRIFKNEYLSPRSPYTTLQIPKQGIGEWCHPMLTADIDDSGLRKAAKDNIFRTPMDIPFRTVGDSAGNNIAFTSLWDNFPDSLSVPLSGKASHVYLMMAGTTNHMQCHITNGIVEILYKEGTTATLELVNPETWAPIEQDFYVDGKAFSLKCPRPYRVALKSGVVSRNLAEVLKISPAEVYGRSIGGGAGIILDLPLDPKKELMELKVKSIANEVIIGLMAATLAR